MKKTILLTGILVLSVSFTFAQFAEKGSMLISGAVSYYGGTVSTESGSSTFEDKQSSTSLSPLFQYFVINNLAVGALLNASLSTTKNDFSKQTETDITFGPVARYYLWQALFVQGYFGFGSGKTKYEDLSGQGGSDSESKVNVIEWVASGGYSVRITDTVILDPMIGFWSNTQTNSEFTDNKVKTNQFCIQIGFTILINK